jgi:polynucleotide 5'-triphosphatase
MSVSPKTQPPVLPRTEIATSETLQTENGRTPTPKRKMDDSELDDSTKPKSANGSQHGSASDASVSGPTKKRIRYTEPPIWARSVSGRVKNNGLINSKWHKNSKLPLSHQIKLEANGDPHISSTVPKSRLQTPQADNKEDGPLGPWEPSITGIRPYEEISKLVADWLYVTVVSRDDAGELASRGVEVEIEAKLGQLINKDTNDRFILPVKSECILADTGRVSFQSSMTEVSLNKLVL